MLRFVKVVAIAALTAAPLLSFAASATKKCTSPFNKTAGLECISCGVEDYTGQVPSEKYLALLGFATQHYYEGTNPRTAKEGVNAEQNFRRHIIQQIQAYGFCVGAKLDSKGNLTSKPGYGNLDTNDHSLAYKFINGTRATVNKDGEYSTGMSKDEMKTFLKKLGIARDESKNVFQDERWQYSTPAERQKYFRQQLKEEGLYDMSGKGLFVSKETEGLADCISQLKAVQNDKDSIFNLSTPNPDNQEFCKTLANSCEIKDTSFCMGNIAAQVPEPASESGGNQKGFLNSMKRKGASGVK